MNRQFLTNGTIKQAFFFKEIHSLEVRKSPVIEWYDLLPYVVTINWMTDVNFLYDGENFYLDVANHEENTKAIEKDIEITKQMEAEGKTEEEIKARSAWRWIQFIDRVLILLNSNDDVYRMVNDAINTI